MNKDEQLAELSIIIYTGQSISICAVDVAKVIYDSGYRKASEVAREIIKILKETGIDKWRYPVIEEIEKIYMEGGK